MQASIKSKNQAIDILKDYNGENPYLLKIKKNVIFYQKIEELTPYVVEYILNNYQRTPIKIGKTIKIADWYGEKLSSDYDIEFIPEKIQILVLLGESSVAYHCYIKYRQNMEPLELFIPKKAILGNFLLEDYHKVNVDFDRYDRLSMSKDQNRRLKEHQKEAVQFLLSRKKCILADDMGLGKTTELSVASIEGNFDSVLIICPASLKQNWKDELLWYVNERDISIIDGFNDKNKNELEKKLGYKEGKSGLSVSELKKEAKEIGKWEDNRFVIINFDILEEFYKFPASRSKENINKAIENSPMLKYIMNKKSLIIIDEAHRLSNDDSIRYKIINNLIKTANPDSVFLSTGTPVTNNPQNLYCILKLLNESITDDWKYYMERYCGAIQIPAKGEKEKWTGYFLKKVKKSSYFDLTEKEKKELKEYISMNARKITILKEATNLDELKLRISHMYLRRVKEDLSEGLPKKTIHEVFYNFNAQQKEEYSKLWEEYENAQLEADPTKEINKDLIEGAIYRKYCSNQMVPNTIKLADYFIKNNEKVIIFCCYDEELYSLKEHYGDKCVIYNGKITAKQKENAINEFKNNPEKMVFIGNLFSAGVGITLTNSCKMIFNNISFVPGDNSQACDRIYRIGQKRDVDIYYQLFKNTQYEKMWNTVLEKSLTINSIIKKEEEK